MEVNKLLFTGWPLSTSDKVYPGDFVPTHTGLLLSFWHGFPKYRNKMFLKDYNQKLEFD